MSTNLRTKRKRKKKIQGESFYGIKYVIRIKEHWGMRKNLFVVTSLMRDDRKIYEKFYGNEKNVVKECEHQISLT